MKLSSWYETYQYYFILLGVEMRVFFFSSNFSCKQKVWFLFWISAFLMSQSCHFSLSLAFSVQCTKHKKTPQKCYYLLWVLMLIIHIERKKHPDALIIFFFFFSVEFYCATCYLSTTSFKIKYRLVWSRRNIYSRGVTSEWTLVS